MSEGHYLIGKMTESDGIVKKLEERVAELEAEARLKHAESERNRKAMADAEDERDEALTRVKELEAALGSMGVVSIADALRVIDERDELRKRVAYLEEIIEARVDARDIALELEMVEHSGAHPWVHDEGFDDE